MPLLFWDASGLAKRYVAEVGSDVVNALFAHSPRPAMAGAFWTYSETYAILVRKRNSGQLSSQALVAAVSALYADMIDNDKFGLLSIDDETVIDSVAYILTHNVNSADAALLTSYLDYQASLGESRPTCILVTADLRLIRAAQAEGLQTLNPEMLSLEDVLARIHSTS